MTPEELSKGVVERLAQGFSRIEERRIAVDYIILHPQDLLALMGLIHVPPLVRLNTIWNADIVLGNQLHWPRGIVLVCSRLIEAEPPHNRHQFTEVVDLSDLLRP